MKKITMIIIGAGALLLLLFAYWLISFIVGPAFTLHNEVIINEKSLDKDIDIHLNYSYQKSSSSQWLNFNPTFYKGVDFKGDKVTITKSDLDIDYKATEQYLAKKLNLTHDEFFDKYDNILMCKKYEDASIYVATPVADKSVEYGDKDLVVFVEKNNKIYILTQRITNDDTYLKTFDIVREDNLVFIYRFMAVNLDTMELSKLDYDANNDYLSKFKSIADQNDYIISLLSKNDKIKPIIDGIMDINVIMVDLYKGNVYVVVLGNEGDTLVAVYNQSSEKIIYANHLKSKYNCGSASFKLYKDGKTYDIYNPNKS